MLRTAQQEVHVCFECYYLLLHFVNYLLISFSVKLIMLLLGKFILSFVLYILIIYHKAPNNQDSIAQRTELEISASPRIDTQNTLSVGGGIQGLNATHPHTLHAHSHTLTTHKYT